MLAAGSAVQSGHNLLAVLAIYTDQARVESEPGG
ncbi:hypothetical protein CGMCC3_g10695 [Colletotrichum fructicola]|nr:uncharacterized protein CGMCC3_g10695 [Colletotrichum fructicola]KAE9573281.1 hypothetical protein CGMCC3_g10695 [Colletotrichum fructicola]